MTKKRKDIFQRTNLLLGEENMKVMTQKRVIIFGVGGVGSWCAESLVRSGIQHLTIVDFDTICESNVNRQLHATSQNIGEVKVEVLRIRLLEINPEATITAIKKVYNEHTYTSFQIEEYDFIVDAIDSIESKLRLMREATKTDAVLFSSMGAALRIDPTRIKVGDFWELRGCTLGALLRKRMRRGALPSKPFTCVYSEERLENIGKQEDVDHSVDEHGIRKAITNGTVAHITAIFGFTIAGLIIQSIYNENENI